MMFRKAQSNAASLRDAITIPSIEDTCDTTESKIYMRVKPPSKEHNIVSDHLELRAACGIHRTVSR